MSGGFHSVGLQSCQCERAKAKVLAKRRCRRCRVSAVRRTDELVDVLTLHWETTRGRLEDATAHYKGCSRCATSRDVAGVPQRAGKQRKGDAIHRDERRPTPDDSSRTAYTGRDVPAEHTAQPTGEQATIVRSSHRLHREHAVHVSTPRQREVHVLMSTRRPTVPNSILHYSDISGSCTDGTLCSDRRTQ